MRDDNSTVLANEQAQYLKKTLGRFDIIFLVMSAVLSIEIIAQTAGFGGETFTWTLVLAITFLVPYALIFAETGSARRSGIGPPMDPAFDCHVPGRGLAYPFGLSRGWRSIMHRPAGCITPHRVLCHLSLHPHLFEDGLRQRSLWLL